MLLIKNYKQAKIYTLFRGSNAPIMRYSYYVAYCPTTQPQTSPCHTRGYNTHTSHLMYQTDHLHYLRRFTRLRGFLALKIRLLLLSLSPPDFRAISKTRLPEIPYLSPTSLYDAPLCINLVMVSFRWVFSRDFLTLLFVISNLLLLVYLMYAQNCYRNTTVT